MMTQLRSQYPLYVTQKKSQVNRRFSIYNVETLPYKEYGNERCRENCFAWWGMQGHIQAFRPDFYVAEVTALSNWKIGIGIKEPLFRLEHLYTSTGTHRYKYLTLNDIPYGIYLDMSSIFWNIVYVGDLEMYVSTYLTFQTEKMRFINVFMRKFPFLSIKVVAWLIVQECFVHYLFQLHFASNFYIPPLLSTASLITTTDTHSGVMTIYYYYTHPCLTFWSKVWIKTPRAILNNNYLCVHIAAIHIQLL